MARVLPLFTAVALLGACAAEDDLGTIDLSLTGRAPSGATYRLREGELLLAGGGTSRTLLTESDPTRTSITTRLPAGAYTLGIATGWHLERVGADGVGRRVTASLVSANPQPLTITAGEVTRTLLLFDVDGQPVPIGDGDLEIGIGVNDVDAGVPDATPPVDAGPPGPDALPTAPQATGNDMLPGEVLAPNTQITSLNGHFHLRYNPNDGLRIVRAATGQSVWWSGVTSAPSTHCIMQLDGNLVLYRPDGTPVWASHTHANPGASLVIGNDGAAVISLGATRLWSTPVPPQP